jgi:uncharacterized protein YqjF (DUF2071 family)
MNPWLSPQPPAHIRPGVMVQRWLDLSFIHWRFDPETVAELLPTGVEPDLFDGSAWVALIPFRLELRTPRTPTLPWASRFPEANVRTYVRGPDGKPGIWFLSLDASRLGAVAVARRTYGLPYMWADLNIERHGQVMRYTGHRRQPYGRAASFEITLEHGRPRPVSSLGGFEQFVACRWRLYSPQPLALPARDLDFAVTMVDHPEWQIAQARIRRLRSTMLEAAGLPTPTQEPLAHFSPGVQAHFGLRTACPARPLSVVGTPETA